MFPAAAIIGSVGLVAGLVFGTSPAALAAGLASGVLVADVVRRPAGDPGCAHGAGPTRVSSHEPEIDRLTLEAEVWRREAEALIMLAGPSPSARCLDACCGPLGALAALADAAPDRGQQ